MPRKTYLLCFAATPVGHSTHYIGSTKDLRGRLIAHRYGHGAALTRELKRRGGKFKHVRTWNCDRETELKAQKNARRLCPICNPASYQRQKRRRTATLRCKQAFARKLVRDWPDRKFDPKVAKYLPQQ